MARLFLCRQCNAMVAATDTGAIADLCECGSRYFVPPRLAPWRLTDFDHRFLVSLRISPGGELNGRLWGNSMTEDPRDQLVRLNVAALELGVSSKTVKKYCRCAHLRCKQLPSGQWRVYRSSLDAAIREEQTAPNRPE